jgi:hypothetical protein
LSFNYSNLAELHCDDDWRIAVHESGHAIAGVRNDSLDFVRVGSNELGEVRWIKNPLDSKDEEFTLDELRYWQTIYAAGAAAEHIVFNEIRRHSIRKDIICHLRVDLKCQRGPVDLFESAIERAVCVLRKTNLERVARELMQAAKKELTYDDICTLIGVKPSWER